jgi:glycosyltransferase involved in cell wall biosynthesis
LAPEDPTRATAPGGAGLAGEQGAAARSEARRPLAVLHMLHRPSLGSGAREQMIEAAQGLAARGHHASVLTRADAEIEQRCHDLGVGYRALKLRHPLDVGSMRRLAELVEAGGVDVVHVHCGTSLGVALGAAALGARFVLVANRASSFRPRPLLVQALRSARVHRIVATSRTVRDALVASGKLPAEKVFVVPGSVDLTRFDPARCRPRRARHALGVPEGARLIGHVGVREWKGWKHALAALAEVRGVVPEAHLLLIGCTTERRRREVRELVDEVALSGHVTATLMTRELADVLAACDVVVDPSWAGTAVSGVVREAMALSRPVVATDVGGNADLIEDGVSGLLVPPRDVPTLAAAIVRLLSDGELAGRLGGAARSRVAAEFSVAMRAIRLEAVYRAALAEHAASG